MSSASRDLSSPVGREVAHVFAECAAVVARSARIIMNIIIVAGVPRELIRLIFRCPEPYFICSFSRTFARSGSCSRSVRSPLSVVALAGWTAPRRVQGVLRQHCVLGQAGHAGRGAGTGQLLLFLLLGQQEALRCGGGCRGRVRRAAGVGGARSRCGAAVSGERVRSRSAAVVPQSRTPRSSNSSSSI